MADKKELSLEERQVIALEKQAKATEKLTYAVEDIADFFHTADIGKFTEKYLPRVLSAFGPYFQFFQETSVFYLG